MLHNYDFFVVRRWATMANIGRMEDKTYDSKKDNVVSGDFCGFFTIGVRWGNKKAGAHEGVPAEKFM